MALSLRKSTSFENVMYSIHNNEGRIVQLFPIQDEKQLKIIGRGAPFKFKWTWIHESIVFGTLSDSGVVQIWDLHTRRAVITIATGISNSLWANFLISPDIQPILYVKDKEHALNYKVLCGDGEASITDMKSIDSLETEIGFCRPELYKNSIVCSNSSKGIARIGFTSKNTAVTTHDGMVISNILPRPIGKVGMVVLVKVLGDWLIVAYESGKVHLYDLGQDLELANCNLKDYYTDSDGEVPIPLACDGSAEMGQFVIAVGTSSPKLFVMDTKLNCYKNEPLDLSLSDMVELDGSAGLAMHPYDVDMIAVSGLSGNVDIYTFPTFTHLLNIPHRETLIRNLMFLPKASESSDDSVHPPKLFLLCASETSVSFWNLPLMMRGCI